MLVIVCGAACSDDSPAASDAAPAIDAAVAAVDAAVVDAAPPDAAVPVGVESQGWTVTAETPLLMDDGTVVGSVTFTRASGADTRGGGLCLVADLNDGFPCTTDADCDGLDVPPEGHHYCDGVNGSPNKTCWTRPGGDPYCTRSPARTPGTYTTSAVPALVDGKATTWMGHACMAIETSPMGCGSGDPAQYVTASSPTVVALP